ncbi:hypothetical protein M011DRAFT_453519 [Sporormia fimetaria CBS 119925]|uniref:Cytochrome P450 n=1 Tax=Sporormia fimetaria CBS 119925 TaxID=1340428 RepID=A0A6A6UXL2_9PLEO|nr:hypothetical protein M011DRAFT_453519 [Sporormia fimetaria CBS 119925]
MVSSKTVFLGVYTSGGLLTWLFLPLCYLLLLSPFVLLALRYTDFDQRVLHYIPDVARTPDVWAQVLIAFVAVALATRFLSARHGARDERPRRVQLLPYWIPGVRHWGNVVLQGENWLKSVRDTSVNGVVAYNLSGKKHNVVLSAPLLETIVGNSNSLEEDEIPKNFILSNAYGLPGSCRQPCNLRPLITAKLESELFKGPKLEELATEFTHRLSEMLPDFVTFNSSIVDQFPWERVAGTELTDGTEEAEIDFFALVSEFFCRAMVPLITGPQFPESYELLATDLATVNQSFYALALGLPRFFPLPGLPGALLARKRLLHNLCKVFKALESPPVKREIPDDESVSGEETDADVLTLLTALHDQFSKAGIPIAARASLALEFLHTLYAKTVPVAFWTLLHIYRSSEPSDKTSEEEKEEQNSRTPLSSIRNETRQWCQAIQPPSIHPSFPAPPEVLYSGASELFNPSLFPCLRSSIFEAKRLYTSTLKQAHITQDIVFTESTLVPAADKEEWKLDAGTTLDVGLSERLINTSAAEYLDPDQFNPFRFSRAPSPLSVSTFDDSGEFVDALLIAFVAGVTQLWEISAAPKKGFLEKMQEAQAAAVGEEVGEKKKKKEKGVWVVPKAVDGASVMVPKSDVRVRVRRREGLPPKQR